jgi:hypothetical protein
MKRIAVMSVGTLILLLGTVSMVTPIPGGTFLLAGGSVLLICASPWFRRCLQYARVRIAKFDRLMKWLESRTGERIGSVLKLTRPDYQPQSGDHGVR